MSETPENQAHKNSTAGVVDIVFILDVTGSMSSCINAVKDNIANFVRVLTERDANGGAHVKDWRAKVVGYRDHDYDKQDWFIDNSFVSTDSELRDQLSRLQASGGGDEPESLLDAIWQVLEMESTAKDATADPQKWRYRSVAHRFLVVFTDASFHPKIMLPGAAGGTVSDVVNKIHQNKIKLYLYAPEIACHYDLGAADKGEYLAIPCDSDAPEERVNALAEFTKDQQNFRKIVETLGKSMSKSASVETLD